MRTLVNEYISDNLMDQYKEKLLAEDVVLYGFNIVLMCILEEQKQDLATQVLKIIPKVEAYNLLRDFPFDYRLSFRVPFSEIKWVNCEDQLVNILVELEKKYLTNKKFLNCFCQIELVTYVFEPSQDFDDETFYGEILLVPMDPNFQVEGSVFCTTERGGN